jgi:hypothetical protein
MLPRITTVKPRPSSSGALLRAFDVTIVCPDHRATYTVLAPNGREANAQASALFDGRAQPFVLPELAVA